MALQFSEIKTEVRAAFAARTDLDARLAIIINQAQKRIARIKSWKELYTSYSYTIPYTGTPANDKVVTLSDVFGSDRVRRIITIRLVLANGRSRKLRRRDIRQFDGEIPEPEYFGTGTPEKYIFLKDTIELWRVPDETLTSVWRTYNWPADLSGDTDESDLEDKDDLIIALSLVYAANSLQLFDEAKNWAMYGRTLLKEAMGEEPDTDDLDILPAFESVGGHGIGDYWTDPFVVRSP